MLGCLPGGLRRTMESDLRLSDATLAALNEVLAGLNKEKNSEAEDWSLNQFWYTEETTEALLTEAIRASNGGRIAFLSAPSLYFLAQKRLVPNTVHLFEFDDRFACYGDDFTHWDCNNPLNIPESLHHTFDFVFGDPPHLNTETAGSFLQACELLARTPETPIAMITSTTLSDFVCRTMGGRPSIFPVKHKQLANPMTLYLSYESPAMPFDPFYPDYPLRHERCNRRQTDFLDALFLHLSQTSVLHREYLVEMP
ncbi:putative N-6 adenine-specific DNA methylase [Paratrimastix pyriformis]|uniref:N-6 adenine-specific DNA methylase n=1 Tax=Paratrimastix pyriformis TaxID=342808 RepID=A0ABQ8UL53_9EUKA|nr:putative N-6 adenine-specific DNA methylase [Paratrimastix pyriformis]